MNEYSHHKHTTYECKYHLVFIPKYRKKKIFGLLRTFLGELFHDLVDQKGCNIIEGHLHLDHVHMLITIPPKYSVSDIVGFIKGKSAIQIARHQFGIKKNLSGMKFWARVYFVSTVGLDEEVVRTYIYNQEKEDKRIEQMTIFDIDGD